MVIPCDQASVSARLCPEGSSVMFRERDKTGCRALCDYSLDRTPFMSQLGQVREG